MTQVNIYFDTRYKGERKKYPLYYRIYLPGNRNIVINSRISVAREHWNGYKVVKHNLRDLMNRKLRDTISSIEDILLSIDIREGLAQPNKVIKGKICAYLNGVQYHAERISFTDYFEGFIEKVEKPSTARIYAHTLRKIRDFAAAGVYFDEVTASWLENFEEYLKHQHLDQEGSHIPGIKKLSVNGINIHFRNLRSVYRHAMRKEIISGEKYPFDKIAFKTEETIHRDLSVRDIQTIRDYQVEEHQRFYRDIFMLIFYLGGINLGDLCLLRDENYRNGRIEFVRQKTGVFVSVKVEPEAQTIIERWKGNSYLISALDNYGNYKDFNKKVNKNLKEIGPVVIGKQGKKTRTPLFPFLTTYYARHSFATIASNEADVSDEVIGQILGHREEKKVTSIYINRSTRKMDIALRSVLDILKVNMD